MVNGAVVMLGVNIAVGLIFMMAFSIVAFAQRGQKRALWFGVSYLLGTLAPACDIISSMVGYATPVDWIGYSCFLTGLLSMSLSFTYFKHEPRPWRAALGILILGLALRTAISSWPKGTLVYGAAYQAPFVMAGALDTLLVFRLAQRRKLYLLLGSVFALTTIHFLFKPLLLIRFGGPQAFFAYTRTVYALLSQAATGVLLLACGIVLLVIVSQKALTDSELASETDSLSSLLNRRGFDRQGRLAIRRASERNPVTAILFDIDHFKKINDTYGHEIGDLVIAEFGALLLDVMPSACLAGRMGGEEFAMLIEGAHAEHVRLYAETVRKRFPIHLRQHLLYPTVSAGISEWKPGETLADVMRRADQALYQAKESGRNRVCFAVHSQRGATARTAAPDEAEATDPTANLTESA